MSDITQHFTETQYKAMPGQISTDDSLGIVECFVAAIGNKDSVGDVCMPGAFNASLKRRKPRVVWGHNWNEPIGKVLDIYEVGPKDPRLPLKMKQGNVGGLFARVQFNLKSERGREAFSNVSFFGEEQEWSIGYKTLDAVYDTGRQANMLKEVELYEVSPVLHGANQLTATISIKSDESEIEEKASDGPCWPGYKQIGMKKGKNGNMVPNCVPINSSSEKTALKDPDGGLTAAGRAHFKRKEGANLKPGVKGRADTPTKMRRKGSFLTRFFTNPSGPMQDEKGRPTRLALSARAWGEPVPQNASDAAALAAKGRRMLERYQNSKKSDESAGIEEKNYAIYSEPSQTENPITGKMGMLARYLGTHFGGNVTVREADENNVIFDLERDGKQETLRVGYHSPEPGSFMFGVSSPVRAQVVYVSTNQEIQNQTPIKPNAMMSGKPAGDCGCGCKGEETCNTGEKMQSWSEYKNDTPGIHLFVKTQNIDTYDVVNQISNDFGLEVELLRDGFAVPNIDWHGPEVQNKIMEFINVEEKGLARGIKRGLKRGLRGRRPQRDGDGDGMMTNPITGRDDIPAPRRPKMMPPREIPQEVPEKEPVRTPIRTPQKPAVPSRPSVPSRPAPVRPSVPAGVSGRMSAGERKRLGEHLLRQLREYEFDLSNPSGSPKRAMEMALNEIAERNRMTRKNLDRMLKKLIMRERRMAVLRRAGRRKSAEGPSVYISISETSDLEVKSGFQVNSKDIDTLLIDVEPEMMFSVKSAIDEIGSFYGFDSTATDLGIEIPNSSGLSDEAVSAIANAYMNISGTFDLVDIEFNRLTR